MRNWNRLMGRVEYRRAIADRVERAKRTLQQPNIRTLFDGVVLRGYVLPHGSAPVEPVR
jgi:hypothetical protein